mmetsp:Transcript_43794/g.110416  ORF Transcript_43794/g.110416 Transcript_43794/m.110416 type:complete len:297 (+) Transcript_43794:561-1451(+)
MEGDVVLRPPGGVAPHGVGIEEQFLDLAGILSKHLVHDLLRNERFDVQEARDAVHVDAGEVVVHLLAHKVLPHEHAKHRVNVALFRVFVQGVLVDVVAQGRYALFGCQAVQGAQELVRAGVRLCEVAHGLHRQGLHHHVRLPKVRGALQRGPEAALQVGAVQLAFPLLHKGHKLWVLLLNQPHRPDAQIHARPAPEERAGGLAAHPNLPVWDVVPRRRLARVQLHRPSFADAIWWGAFMKVFCQHSSKVGLHSRKFGEQVATCGKRCLPLHPHITNVGGNEVKLHFFWLSRAAPEG